MIDLHIKKVTTTIINLLTTESERIIRLRASKMDNPLWRRNFVSYSSVVRIKFEGGIVYATTLKVNQV